MFIAAACLYMRVAETAVTCSQQSEPEENGVAGGKAAMRR